MYVCMYVCPLKSDAVSEANTCDVHGSQHARWKTSKEPLSAIKDKTTAFRYHTLQFANTKSNEQTE